MTHTHLCQICKEDFICDLDRCGDGHGKFTEDVCAKCHGLQRLAINMCAYAQMTAYAPITGKKVGAAVIAAKPNPYSNGLVQQVFWGCNIELSDTKKRHAEVRALEKALEEGYTIIQGVFVTSSSFQEAVLMCLGCRDEFFRGGFSNIPITVLNPDGTIKMRDWLGDSVKHPPKYETQEERQKK